MKAAFITVFILCLALVLLISCNDSEKGKLLTPHESNLAESVEDGVKILKKLDMDLPGDPLNNPENYYEVEAIEWDGVSKLKQGVTYRFTQEQFKKLAETHDEYADMYNSYRKNLTKCLEEAERTGKRKHSTRETKLAEHATALASCGGVMWGEGQAQGPNGAWAIVDIDGTVYSDRSFTSLTAYQTAVCFYCDDYIFAEGKVADSETSDYDFCVYGF